MKNLTLLFALFPGLHMLADDALAFDFLYADSTEVAEVHASSVLSGGRLLDIYGEPTNEGYGLLSAIPGDEWFITDLSGDENLVVIELAERFDLTRVVAINTANEEGWPGMSVRRMRLEHGPGAEGPWNRLLEVDLQKGNSPQQFSVDAKAVRYLRFSAVSNYGSEMFTGLGELQIWGMRTTPRKVDFNGAWSTPHGDLILKQDGERITGCFGYDWESVGENIIEGTLEGSVFSGIWRNIEDGGARGAVLFALTETGELSGVYGNEGEPPHARWDGIPAAGINIICEMPEHSLADELDRRGMIALYGILFDTGKDDIKPESLPLLESLAEAMKNRPGLRYMIEGHTDNRGGVELNQRLSEQRAASVRRWLIDNGIDSTRLESKGHGLSKPVMPNDTEAGRAANRRVEVSIL